MKNIAFAAALAAAALAVPACSQAAVLSGCAPVTIKHSTTPVEASFKGGRVPLTIDGFTGSYKADFLAYLKTTPLWGLADNGKYIAYQNHVHDDNNIKQWRITDSAAPVGAQDQFGIAATFGKLYKAYAASGRGVLAVHDASKFPFHHWYTLPGYSGSKEYIVLDHAAENDSNLVVIYEQGGPRNDRVDHSDICMVR